MIIWNAELNNIPHETLSFPAHNLLLEVGKKAKYLHFVKKGVLRM